MQHLVGSVRISIATQNWYSALALALALPDICARVDNPLIPSSRRYLEWWEKFVQPRYVRPASRFFPETVFLSGADVYALRCAFLHEGREDISEQKAQKALSRFHFVTPSRGMVVHNNRSNDVLQLQVDIFCEDVCEGVERWMLDSQKFKEGGTTAYLNIYEMPG